MVTREEKRSLRAASCCRVEVVNGAAGRRLYGLVSTERTENAADCRAAASARAASSFRWVTLEVLRVPSSAKSLPVATRLPSTATSLASKPSEDAVRKRPVRSQ
ncbi:Uncharacterised protein [Mycobacterium tuberculosis]|nr:Uncharacterised protein [Mycobacterium tuberculosis]